MFLTSYGVGFRGLGFRGVGFRFWPGSKDFNLSAFFLLAILGGKKFKLL